MCRCCTARCSAFLALALALGLGLLLAAAPRAPRHLGDAACANPVPEAESYSGAVSGLPWRCGWQKLREGGGDPTVWAYVQPNGSWSWSNAGAVELPEASEALLVDTLMDPVLTRSMLDMLAQRSTSQIRWLAWTHPDVDHILGNQELPASVERIGPAHIRPYLVEGIKSAKTFTVVLPVAHALWAGAQQLGLVDALKKLPPGPVQDAAVQLLGLARALDWFARYNVHAVDVDKALTNVLSRTLTDEELKTSAKVGPSGLVEYRYMGPIHSKGDSVMLVPASCVAFVGDLLFVGVHPVMWSGSATHWVEALEALLQACSSCSTRGEQWLFVPGHGPVVTADGVQSQVQYFKWLAAEVRASCPEALGDASGAQDAACAQKVLAAMPLPFSAWPEPERVLLSAAVECRAQRSADGHAQVAANEKSSMLGALGAHLVRSELRSTR